VTVSTNRATLRRALIGGAIALPVALAGCSAQVHETAQHSEPKYGSLPSFLPKSSIQADSVLTGTAAKPALTTEGDAVRVELSHGSVLATVAGPVVPGEGLPYQAEATTATWTVTIRDATAAIPIRAADFTSIDHLGVVYRPTFVKGQPRPPKVLKPGASTTFELRTVMQVGEGLMRWAPDGTHIVGSWDFEVEND
jgi:hypothetical protein